MITVTVGKKKYKGVYNWDELTLSKYCDLAAIPMPEGYKDFILADGKFTPDNIQPYVDAVSKITDKQLTEDFPAYYRRVILCLTNIPERILNRVSDEAVTERYEYYFKPFVVSLIYHKPVIHFMGQLRDYEPGYISKGRVRIGMSYYYLPKTVNIDGIDIPLKNEPVVTYIEACDLFRDMMVSREAVSKLALFMAIYLRMKGERYDESKALNRRSVMMQVPMSVVWAVFFYTVRRLPLSTMSTRLFGTLQRSTAQCVSEVRTYRSMALVD